jgi:hypothetical protein
MTIPVFLLLFVLILILVIALVCITADDDPALATILFFLGMVGLLSYCHLTPSTSVMKETRYKNILADRPKCMDDSEQAETVECLNDYKAWLEDSLYAVHKLDSIKAVKDSIKENINFIKGNKTNGN